MTGIANCNFVLNEEFLVIASHHLAMISSLFFVHTARRFYQLNGKMNSKDRRALLTGDLRRIALNLAVRRKKKS